MQKENRKNRALKHKIITKHSIFFFSMVVMILGIIGVVYAAGNTSPGMYRGSYETQQTDDALGTRGMLYVTGEVKGYAEVEIGEVEKLASTKGTPPVPKGAEHITFEVNTKEWTNQDVEVKMATDTEGYNIEYQKDETKEGNWKKGNTYIAKENGSIYARLVTTKGESGEWTKIEIGNIDKEAPGEFTPETTVGETTITIKANAPDNLSGIKEYKYYVGGSYRGSGGSEYTVSGLNDGTAYEVYVIAIDNAGNERQSNKVNAKTIHVHRDSCYQWNNKIAPLQYIRTIDIVQDGGTSIYIPVYKCPTCGREIEMNGIGYPVVWENFGSGRDVLYHGTWNDPWRTDIRGIWVKLRSGNIYLNAYVCGEKTKGNLICGNY